MRPVLIDADAFICLHGLKLLTPVVGALAAVRTLCVTEYVARRELSDLSTLVSDLEAAGQLRVEPVRKGDIAFDTWKKLRAAGADKGEAELVAWALAQSVTPILVTRDCGATALAIAWGVPATDVMGIVVEACETAGLGREDARDALAVWDDKGQQRCRPSPYRGFDATYAERLEQRRAWSDD